MQTPWSNLRIADAHVHFLSHRFFSLLARQKPDLRDQPVESIISLLGWQAPPEQPEILARQWVQELDRFGVARCALIASLPGDEESVATAVKTFPDRFYGYFMLNPCAPDAVERTEKALLRDGMRTICLFPAMHGYSMHDERVDRLLNLAASHKGTVVFVHCGVLTVGVRKKLGLSSHFDMRYSNPIDLHAIALRYPQVPFVIPHFGAGFLREALMLCDLCPNVHIDTSSTNSWMRYLEPGIDLKSVYRRALDVVGPRRLLFGTDSSFFPRGWHAAIFETQVQALAELGVTAEDAQRIFGGNLERLLSANAPTSA